MNKIQLRYFDGGIRDFDKFSDIPWSDVADFQVDKISFSLNGERVILDCTEEGLIYDIKHNNFMNNPGVTSG